MKTKPALEALSQEATKQRQKKKLSKRLNCQLKH